MEGKCKVKDCPAPISCHESDDYKTCPNWEAAEAGEVKKNKKEVSVPTENAITVNWTGRTFTSPELSLIGARSSPTVIGIFGKADAGKTTFLAMVYTLLLNGKKLEEYEFAGTKTIHGWDELYHWLKLQQGNVAFPPPTPASANIQYHLALRNQEGLLKDILFCDAAGEAFTIWANDRSDINAANARWIYANSSAFMLFIDCDALLNQKNLAKREIINIAQQLTHDLGGRPVIAAWSKSDKKEKIIASLKDSLSQELHAMFPNFKEIDISNFLDPGPDELVHKNNLEAINWLLQQSNKPSSRNMSVHRIDSDDFFLNYGNK